MMNMKGGCKGSSMMADGKGKPVNKGDGKGSGMEDLAHGTVSGLDRWSGQFLILQDENGSSPGIQCDPTVCDTEDLKNGDYVAVPVVTTSGHVVAKPPLWKLYGVR